MILGQIATGSQAFHKLQWQISSKSEYGLESCKSKSIVQLVKGQLKRDETSKGTLKGLLQLGQLGPRTPKIPIKLDPSSIWVVEVLDIAGAKSLIYLERSDYWMHCSENASLRLSADMYLLSDTVSGLCMSANSHHELMRAPSFPVS